MAEIIDGKKIAREIRGEIRAETARLRDQTGAVPGLAVILAGDDPASGVYVRMKEKACREAGFASFTHRLEDETDEAELLSLIDRLNGDPEVDGILVQLPLPARFNERKVIEAVSPLKDVDGFHPLNLGRLLRGEEGFLPCTPLGIVELLRRSGYPPDGKHVVVVGRSTIVGKPLALMLARKAEGANATVTLCHTGTADLGAVTRRAEILIVAAGRPNTITAPMVGEGTVVIDVGVNVVGQTAEGKRILAGDVDFPAVAEKAAAITPVPGGVGPMTIAMLLRNTLSAFRRRVNFPA
ncbi:MAG: bifunctional methylenetetrahydrofolate dehydrogenase/methenyltetrahydrofolate cyclohydrolase FolD [Candidatus Erginobacter occultus]|nr:bifunctional methylenetetrahydrofolate dehydrogenase/methenyltetrahydrofolate cyclohydrolase FolD [Candidatus Erginobacter occultus]